MYSTLYSSWYASLYTVLSTSYADISFNEYNLQNGSVNIVDIDVETPGNIQYISKDRGLTHGSSFIDKKYRNRNIRMKGYLLASSRQAVEELADEFKKNVDQVQAYLRLKTRGNTYRQILATATNIDMPRVAYHVTKIPFTITFTANNPFFEGLDTESDTFTGITTASYIDSMDNNGSADMGARVILIFGTWNTGVTSVAFTANDRTITITDTFANSDVLVLDMENKKVLLNGIKHDYTGTFPDFPPGVNAFTCAVNGTHNYDILAVKTLKYL